MLKIAIRSISRTIPALLAGAFLLHGCSSKEAPAPTPRTVLVQAAGSADTGTSVYTGEIRARHEADLGFRVAGKMIARLVDAGAEIKPGQALAKLDPADLQLAANAAKAQLVAAESDLATARADRDRYQGLLNQKFVSQAAFDAKENAYKSAQGRAEQARAQSQISGNQAGYGTLSSEYPAIVTAVLAEPGQVLTAGQAVMRVARPEEKEVLIAIPESRLAELKSAKNLTIQLWAAPTIALTGELRELSPAADPATRTYAARIRIINPSAEVRLGMTARVAIGNTVSEQQIIPLSAVVDQGKGPLVWVVVEGKATPRPVKVSQFGEAGALISEGLASGELVVITGTNKLTPGQVVVAKLATPPTEQR
jgi:RND family efflux transporter MFP subunit